MYTFFNGFRPVQQVRKINESIDTLLRDPFWDDFSSVFNKESKGWHSTKTETGWLLEIVVPGFTKEDLKIKMINGELSIVSTNEDNVWLGSFEKLFTLPIDADTKKIKAKVKNGVLTITLLIKENSENSIDIG
jgi:HSP20 family molecular chaperone IbpA